MYVKLRFNVTKLECTFIGTCTLRLMFAITVCFKRVEKLIEYRLIELDHYWNRQYVLVP